MSLLTFTSLLLLQLRIPFAYILLTRCCTPINDHPAWYSGSKPLDQLVHTHSQGTYKHGCRDRDVTASAAALELLDILDPGLALRPCRVIIPVITARSIPRSLRECP